MSNARGIGVISITLVHGREAKNSTKNDCKDARVISQLVKDKRYSVLTF